MEEAQEVRRDVSLTIAQRKFTREGREFAPLRNVGANVICRKPVDCVKFKASQEREWVLS